MDLFINLNAYGGYIHDDSPEPEPAATKFEDSENEISYYVNEYIAEHGEMPDLDETAERFGLKEYTDYEALEKYFERERSMTEWPSTMPLAK